MRHYYIKTTDFVQVVKELFKTTDEIKLEWIEEERGWECDWYVQDYSMWLGKVEIEGKADSSGIPYRRVVWKRLSECNYMDDYFLKPLSDKLELDSGELKMVYAKKEKLTQNGWPNSEEIVLGFEDSRTEDGQA